MNGTMLAQRSLEHAVADALDKMPDGTSLEDANAALSVFGVKIRRGVLRFTANIGNCRWAFPESMTEFSPSVCSQTIKAH